MFDILIGPVQVCRVPPRVYRFPPRDKPADDCRVPRYTDVVVYARPPLRLLCGVLSFFFRPEFTRSEYRVSSGPNGKTPTFGPVDAAKSALPIEPNWGGFSPPLSFN